MSVQLETLCRSHLYLGQAKRRKRWHAMPALALQSSAALSMMAVSNANRA